MDSDSENRAIERVTLDNEQETEKMIRIIQALNITLVASANVSEKYG